MENEKKLLGRIKRWQTFACETVEASSGDKSKENRWYKVSLLIISGISLFPMKIFGWLFGCTEGEKVVREFHDEINKSAIE